jgi:methionine synthase reductase
MANSPLARPGRIRFAFSVIRYVTPKGVPRQGLATSWLANLALPFLSPSASLPSDPILLPIFFRPTRVFLPLPFQLADQRTQEFVYPATSEKKAVVMVGPGTGVAPFIGFLEHRQALGQQPEGEWWLFFGCRHEHKDWIYREEMQTFASNGTLNKLVTAFSRDQEEVVYVQDRMRLHGSDLYRLLLRENGSLYVCGYVLG